MNDWAVISWRTQDGYLFLIPTSFAMTSRSCCR
jgi:hypothetical protein